jgi:integrase
MNSHYYQLKDANGKKIANSYRIQLYVGTGPDGKPRRHTEVFRGRVGDLKKHVAELVTRLNKGVPIPSGRLTVAEHLQRWLDGYVRTNCSARTFEGYESIINRHLIPALGHLQLKDLQPATIQAFYGTACQQVSARTVHHYHRVLFQSLKYAVRQEYLGRNPAEFTDPPSALKKTMRTLKVEIDRYGNVVTDEVTPFLKTAQDSPYYPVIYTALSSGLRQAELLGLRWRDINLHEASISVQQVLFKRRGVCVFKQPKTDRSRRLVNMTPKLALYLASYRAERQKLYQQFDEPLTLDSLVFTNAQGKPVDPSVLSHDFARTVKRAGHSGVRFHDLRHTFASLMLMRGAKPKVISEALGHSSVAFTMDVYSHIMEGMQQEAMALLDKVLPDGVSQENNTDLTPIFEN